MLNINLIINQPNVKKYFFITFFGAILGLLIGYYLVISEQQENVTFTFFDGFLASIIGIITSYLIHVSSIFLDKKNPWQKSVSNRLSVGILVHFSIAFLFVFALLFGYEKWISNTIFNKSLYIKLAILLFIIVLIYEIIYFALYSYYSYATVQIETVKQERKQIELQLNALKSQLSPHFLFNGLNTVSSLVFKDENKAENFIRKLAKMYDYTLKSYDTKLISVAKELEFVNSYLYLVKTRFDKKIDCTIEIADELLNTKIPPLTLQMLVENAVKHNVLTDENPLTISISSDEKQFIIHNNITQKPKKVTSFNIGLKNINERYLLLAQKGITTTNGKDFTVKLPIIR